MAGDKSPEPAMGYPYSGAPPPVVAAQQYHAGMNPYQAGMIPPDAIYGDPKGVPLRQTMFKDTPAPFGCVFCGEEGLSNVRSRPSLASVVACMMPLFMGVCFLCPSMDCLWHKYHFCPSCNQKVGEFKKSDPCMVMDPTRWSEASFALPA